MIHLEPLVIMARSFKKGRTFGDKYECALTITKDGHIGRCHGLTGRLGRVDLEDLLEELDKIGITELIATRNGQERRYSINAGSTDHTST